MIIQSFFFPLSVSYKSFVKLMMSSSLKKKNHNEKKKNYKTLSNFGGGLRMHELFRLSLMKHALRVLIRWPLIFDERRNENFISSLCCSRVMS